MSHYKGQKVVMNDKQILVIKRAVSNQIPKSRFGNFVRDIVFGRVTDKPAAQIDWKAMTELLAYRFPYLLTDAAFKEIYLQVQ
jgi:hypothetical protein